MNKLPLINKLKIGLAGGSGILLIPDNDFSHFEMFAGLERIFRIKKQLFRVGVYGITATNSFLSSDLTVKLGIDFYNPFTNKWEY